MKAKLKDVAALAGVAPNTASTILNRRSNSWASKETEKRVFDAARTLGYTPSRAALALRLGQYRTIGLVIPDLHNPFFTTLADLLERQFRAEGYEMILEHARADIEREQHCFASILERQVDGVVYFVSDIGVHRSFLQKTFASGKAVVAITSQRAQEVDVDTVCQDFSGGIGAAVERLYDLGHRRFAFLSALATGQNDGERQLRFTRLLQSRGIPTEDVYHISCGHDWESARVAFGEFLRQNAGRLPTALIAVNDQSAIAAIRAACEAGLRVPEDLSVVGVDNILLGSYLPRQLSTIEQPLEQIAAASAQMLLARLKAKGEEPLPPQQREFAAVFVDKETIGPVPTAATVV